MNRTATLLAATTSSVAVLLWTATATLAAPVGAGPTSATVSLRPVHPTAASPTYFTVPARAGSTIHDAVVVTNTSEQPANVFVSAVDGLTGQTSGSVYANRQDLVRKAGAWVHVDARELRIRAASSVTVPFTVSVPGSATSGDHLAGIAFENVAHVAGTGSFPITQILRSVIGVRVVLPGPAVCHPVLAAASIDEVGTTGVGAVHVKLGNTGRRLAKPVLSVTVTGAAGYHRTVTRHLDTVLPGDTIDFPLPWPNALRSGDYQIADTLTCDGYTATSSGAAHLGKSLRGTGQPTPASAAVPAPHRSPLSWWPWLVAIIAAAAIGLFVGMWPRRRRMRTNARHRRVARAEQDVSSGQSARSASGTS
jgi:hypothetical protein